MISQDFFDNVETHYNSALPFVLYRLPNRVEVKAMLQKDDTLNRIKNYNESGFVFAPFDNKEETILIPFETSEVIKSDYVMSSTIETSQQDINTSSSEKKEHKNLVQKGIDAINNNKFSKVVLSRVEAKNLSKKNPIKIFKNVLNNYATAFVYCWYHPKVGLWLGATPETLLKVEGNRFSTMALAGTQIYKGTKDVVWNLKEKEEQQIVTNSIVNNLKNTLGNLNTTKAKTIKAGSLLHLKTDISGVLQSNLKIVISKLHPTPAVCGYPKEAAKHFILNNENYNRKFYTGFLGELNLKKAKTRNTNRRNVENNAYATVKTVSNLFVNLRCMQIKNNEALIYVGGGITKDSVPENEWQETINKTQTIKKVLS